MEQFRSLGASIPRQSDGRPTNGGKRRAPNTQRSQHITTQHTPTSPTTLYVPLQNFCGPFIAAEQCPGHLMAAMLPFVYPFRSFLYPLLSRAGYHGAFCFLLYPSFSFLYFEVTETTVAVPFPVEALLSNAKR